MPTTWRLIVDGAVDGALNMALDRAAQVAREQGLVPPTLRLYAWARPTVTLGRFQSHEAVSADVVRSAQLDVVQRFTGGRGVLHDDEVTYSVIASTQDGIPRGVAASYRRLCSALVRTYQLLGVGARLTEHERPSQRSEACYLATTRADLSLGVRKLSGSAQVWSGSTVLQHGSFIISRDVAREAAVFGLDDAQCRRLAAGSVTLAQETGSAPERSRIIEAAVSAFSEELGVAFVRGSWTAVEAEIAGGLVRRLSVRV